MEETTTSKHIDSIPVLGSLTSLQTQTWRRLKSDIGSLVLCNVAQLRATGRLPGPGTVSKERLNGLNPVASRHRPVELLLGCHFASRTSVCKWTCMPELEEKRTDTLLYMHRH
ncbi:hypothetical protein VTK26DRAFT_5707 [Humicola hyalothermophila]